MTRLLYGNTFVARTTRFAWGLLFVLGLGLGVAPSGCDQPPDGTVDLDAGRWIEIRPYPGAAEGTRCFVWRRTLGDASIGGPECVVGGER